MTTATEPLSYSPVLAWDKDSESVYYEIEFFADKPMFLSPTQESDKAIFRSYAIFQNHYNAPLQSFAADLLGKKPLYWRVRGMDLDGKPYTPFSSLAELWTSGDKEAMGAPEPLTDYNNGNGSVLLYPVYHWIPMTGMVRYEIELYEGNPLTDKDAKLVEIKDISDGMMPQADLDKFVGKTGKDLLEAGFESGSSYFINEDQIEIKLANGFYEYTVQFAGEVTPEALDEDFDAAIADLTVKSITYSNISDKVTDLG